MATTGEIQTTDSKQTRSIGIVGGGLVCNRLN